MNLDMPSDESLKQGRNRSRLLLLLEFFEISHKYTNTQASFPEGEGATEIFITHTSAHISLLRVLGNCDST